MRCSQPPETRSCAQDFKPHSHTIGPEFNILIPLHLRPLSQRYFLHTITNCKFHFLQQKKSMAKTIGFLYQKHWNLLQLPQWASCVSLLLPLGTINHTVTQFSHDPHPFAQFWVFSPFTVCFMTPLPALLANIGANPGGGHKNISPSKP